MRFYFSFVFISLLDLFVLLLPVLRDSIRICKMQTFLPYAISQPQANIINVKENKTKYRAALNAFVSEISYGRAILFNLITIHPNNRTTKTTTTGKKTHTTKTSLEKWSYSFMKCVALQKRFVRQY